jgi:hypothetical protein
MIKTHTQESLYIPGLKTQVLKEDIISICAWRAFGDTVPQLAVGHEHLLTDFDGIGAEQAISAILETALPSEWQSEVHARSQEWREAADASARENPPEHVETTP